MEKEKQKKWLMLFGVGMGGLIVAIDFTIVNTVLPLIQDQLGATMNLLQWVMTGFGITFSSFLITAGRLGDLIGHRLVLIIGIIGFGLASLAAGISSTIDELIIARVFQGVFGATVFPTGVAVISTAFSTQEQGKVLGLYGSILGVGLALGPVLGGFITSFANWRWIFLMNIPIIIFSLIICFIVAPESRAKNSESIDWPGMFFLTLLLASVVFVITQMQIYGLFSPFILIPFALAIISLGLLIFVEKKAATPLLPFHMLSNLPFFLGSLVFSICVGLSWSIIFFVPLYLQTTLKLNEFEIGLFLLPMTIMTAIIPIFAGKFFDDYGSFFTTLTALATMVLGLFLTLFFSINLAMGLIIVSFLIIGFSWGTGNGIAMPLALSDPKNRANEGLISGVTITILNVFGILVLSLATALFHHVDQHNLGLVQNDALAFLMAFRAVMGFLLFLALLGLISALIAFKQGKSVG